MKTKLGSEPAFPDGVWAGGMSKRDFFAAIAHNGLLACPEVTGEVEQIAKYAVAHADALLAELEK